MRVLHNLCCGILSCQISAQSALTLSEMRRVVICGDLAYRKRMVRGKRTAGKGDGNGLEGNSLGHINEKEVPNVRSEAVIVTKGNRI